MQQTSKYQFNLVEGSDDFSPTPLNQNMEKVEEALEGMGTAIEESYSPLNKPYVVGSYTGNGGTQSITLGFQPSFVIITAQPANSSDTAFIAISGGSEAASTLSFTETGFTVMVAPTPYETYPLTNQNGRLYHYLAIK